jgi:hypothetical protein
MSERNTFSFHNRALERWWNSNGTHHWYLHTIMFVWHRGDRFQRPSVPLAAAITSERIRDDRIFFLSTVRLSFSGLRDMLFVSITVCSTRVCRSFWDPVAVKRFSGYTASVSTTYSDVRRHVFVTEYTLCIKSVANTRKTFNAVNKVYVNIIHDLRTWILYVYVGYPE